MKQYTAENLLIRPQPAPETPGLVLSITPESAGWKWLSFQVWRLDRSASRDFETGENESTLVNLSGTYTVVSDKGAWRGIGGRISPFERPAHALYLPRRSCRSPIPLANSREPFFDTGLTDETTEEDTAI